MLNRIGPTGPTRFPQQDAIKHHGDDAPGRPDQTWSRTDLSRPVQLSKPLPISRELAEIMVGHMDRVANGIVYSSSAAALNNEPVMDFRTEGYFGCIAEMSIEKNCGNCYEQMKVLRSVIRCDDSISERFTRDDWLHEVAVGPFFNGHNMLVVGEYDSKKGFSDTALVLDPWARFVTTNTMDAEGNVVAEDHRTKREGLVATMGYYRAWLELNKRIIGFTEDETVKPSDFRVVTGDDAPGFHMDLRRSDDLTSSALVRAFNGVSRPDHLEKARNRIEKQLAAIRP